MSWVAVACGGFKLQVEALHLKHGVLGSHSPKNSRFRPCSYCKRPADWDQKEAQCVSCGAKLEEWEEKDL